MQRKLPFRALALASPLLLLSSALAQEAVGPVREEAEAVLIEVTVRVLDREGKPIRGLASSDFTLYDDGKKQTVVGFDAIDLADKTASAAPDEPVSPSARRRFLILFDFSFARPKAILAAQRAAKEFVLSGMGERDLAAVATYSVESGVRLLVTFSADRVQLARAVDTLGLGAVREQGDPLAFAFDTKFLRGMEATVARTQKDPSDLIETLQTMSSLARARNDEYERGRIGSLIVSFGDLARALSVVEGRKDIVYLSEGFHGRYVVGTEDTPQEKDWLVKGEYWKVDADKRYGNTHLRTRLSEMGALFRRTDCVIHAVDIAGLRADAESDPEAVSVGPRETENSLFEISNSTGGEVFRNTNDLGSQLDRLVAQLDLVYVLAYRPDKRGEEGLYHELKVKVARSGARVLARSGYYERRGFRRLTPLERSLSAADVIANEIPSDDIPTRVLATPFAAGGGVASVPVLLEISGERLLAGVTGERTAAEIYVYASDQDNRLQDFFVQAIALDLTKNREKLLAGGLKYWGELALPPGTYRLRTLVRNADTGRMGLTVSSLLVPPFATDQPYLLPPVFLESFGDWVLVRGRGKSAGGEAASSGYPFLALGGDNLAPAALPQVHPGGSSRVCLVAYHFGARDGDNLKIGSQILASDGRPLEAAKLAVLGQSAPEADGKRMLLLSFTTPDGLASGRYGLRIFLQDPVTGQARQAWTPFVVR